MFVYVTIIVNYFDMLKKWLEFRIFFENAQYGIAISVGMKLVLMFELNYGNTCGKKTVLILQVVLFY